jgi:hypothetical protein
MSDLGRPFLPPGLDVLSLRQPLQRTVLVARHAQLQSRPAVSIVLRSIERAAAAHLGSAADTG